jgi:hypothetical protein
MSGAVPQLPLCLLDVKDKLYYFYPLVIAVFLVNVFKYHMFHLLVEYWPYIFRHPLPSVKNVNHT